MVDARHRRAQHIGRRVLAVVAAVVSAMVGVVVVGSPAQAFPSTVRGYAYVWANSAGTAVGTPYTPSLSYQYNSAGGTNTVTRTGIGVYTVRFPYLGTHGTALVTAFGSTEDRCKVGGWSLAAGVPGYADTVLTVRCHTRLGAPVNTQFTASYTYPSSAPRSAYLWNDQTSAPVGTAYTPSLSYQYNSEGLPNQITHTSTGTYVVRLPGLWAPVTTPRELLVNAYGSPVGDASAYCAMDSPPISDATDGVYHVACFNSSGARIDSMFVLTYVESGNHLLAPTATHPTAKIGLGCGAPAGTLCSPSWPFDTDPVGTITVTPLGGGQYQIMMPVPLSNGNVQIGQYFLDGANRGRCKVAFWNPTDGVRVRCDDLSGATPEIASSVVSFVR